MLTVSDLDTKQKQAYDTIISGNNAFISGDAGTGKSTVVNLAIKTLKHNGQNVITIAPTGVAAQNVGGLTIHRFLKITPKNDLFKQPNMRTMQALRAVLSQRTTIIIDEISMCSIDLFEYLIKAVQATKARYHIKFSTQFVFVGDFYQLPPVVTPTQLPAYQMHYPTISYPYYCFNSVYWKNLQMKNIILTQAQRQKHDKDLQIALNSIRKGERPNDVINWFNQNASIGMDNFDDDAITVVGTNNDADKYNQAKLDELETRLYTFHPDTSHMKFNQFENDKSIAPINLKVGARVMCLINGEDSMRGGKYYNGKLGTVMEIESDSSNVYAAEYDSISIGVEFDDGDCADFGWVQEEQFGYNINQTTGKMVKQNKGYIVTIPLKIAYAITIHKSQGQTYPQGINLMPNIFTNGQLYVALSRITDVKGLHIANWLTPNQVMVDLQVKKFYEDISKGIDNRPADQQFQDPTVTHIFDPTLDIWVTEKQYYLIKKISQLSDKQLDQLYQNNEDLQ